MMNGARVLVPPSRPELNPLLFMLRRDGVEAVEFPHLQVGPPAPADLQRALEEGGSADWIVFSGGLSASHWLAAGGRPERARLGAIGHAAEQALRQAGLPVAAAPRQHTAQAVADELEAVAGSLRGKRLLLLRAAAAGSELTGELARRGATLIEVEGYSLQVQATASEAAQVFGPRLDAVAFANPSAVRVLARAARQLGHEPRLLLGGLLCAVAGPATAEEARRHQLAPELMVQPRDGRSLPTLAAALLERLAR